MEEEPTTPEAPPTTVPAPGRWIWALPFAAVMVVVVAVAAWIALLRTWPAQARAILATNIALLSGGKIAAISIGLAAGGKPLFVSLYVFAGDFVGLFLLYPFTQVGVDRWLVRAPRLGAWLSRMQARAAKHPLVQRWGGFGLFVIALVPFSLNTPLLDALIGRLAGLRTHQILVPLMAEMTIMNLVYLWLFERGLVGLSTADRIHVLVFVGAAAIGASVIFASYRRWRRVVPDRPDA